MVTQALSGDVRSIMEVVSQDADNQIKGVIDQLVAQNVCSRREAEVALGLFGWRSK